MLEHVILLILDNRKIGGVCLEESLHNGHRQRLKKRFLQEGLQNFEDHEILQLILFYAIPMKDTNELAHLLLEKYGSISKVVEADPKDLVKIDGISEHSAILLNILPQFYIRYKTDRGKERICLDSLKKAGEFIRNLYYGISYEIVYILCLDVQHNLIHYEILHEGTIDEASIYPRLVVESALRHKAHSIILSHNHPGGTLDISKADIDATKRIISALSPIEIDVMDHIIITGDRYISFAEQGVL